MTPIQSSPTAQSSSPPSPLSPPALSFKPWPPIPSPSSKSKSPSVSPTSLAASQQNYQRQTNHNHQHHHHNHLHQYHHHYYRYYHHQPHHQYHYHHWHHHRNNDHHQYHPKRGTFWQLTYVVRPWERRKLENIKAFRVAQTRVLTTTKSRITTFELWLTQAIPLRLKT